MIAASVSFRASGAESPGDCATRSFQQGAVVASDDEVLHFIDERKLMGTGIGYIDVHLLASVALTADAQLWTRDKRLHAVAASLRFPMRTL